MRRFATQNELGRKEGARSMSTIGDPVAFMRDLEERYKQESRLTDRSHYKIFYGPIRPAQILVLGINPGGDLQNVEPNGAKNRNGEIAAASAGFYENGECDPLDCSWKENGGLMKLLVPLLEGKEEAIRNAVVKTNLAFRRSRKATDIDIAMAKLEAQPFLQEIIGVVQPRLVILTSVDLTAFLKSFCRMNGEVSAQIKDPGVKQVVFETATAQLCNCVSPSVVVRVAHASQFSWTYSKPYGGLTVLERIMGAVQAQQSAVADGAFAAMMSRP